MTPAESVLAEGEDDIEKEEEREVVIPPCTSGGSYARLYKEVSGQCKLTLSSIEDALNV